MLVMLGVVVGISVYPKVIIDNIVQIEKAYEIYIDDYPSFPEEPSGPIYLKGATANGCSWTLLGYLTISAMGSHSYFGPLPAGEYKVVADSGAICYGYNYWTWNTGTYPISYVCVYINGNMYSNHMHFFTREATEAHWKGEEIVLNLTEGEMIDGHFFDAGTYSDNHSTCTVAIYGRLDIDYIKVFPDPAYICIDEQQQFIAKGYGFGENGIGDGDPDSDTYAPAGDDTGPVDIDAAWATSVAPEVGIIDEDGLFAAGDAPGSGEVTATFECEEKALTDSADVSVFAITLRKSSEVIQAKTSWRRQKRWERMLRLFIRTAPRGHEERVSIELKEFKAIDPRPYTDPRTGDGTLAKETNNKWRYQSFKEPKNQKHPVWLYGVFVSATVNGNPCVEDRFYLDSVFYNLGKRSPRPPRNRAWKYAKWKYSVDTGGLRKISYRDNQDEAGLTHTFTNKCTLGPPAFSTENYCAGVLGHENVHGVQSWQEIVASTISWLLGGPDWCEVEAYNILDA